MNKKIIVKSIVIVCLLISIFVFKYFNININNLSNNHLEGTIEGLKFSEIDFMFDPNKGSYLTINISNLSDKNIVIDGLKIISKDKNNKTINEVEVKIYVELEGGESFDYSIFTSKDIISGNDSYEYIPNII